MNIVPVVWLLGKTQAGKTSLVAELTGEAWEDVGNGFERSTLLTRMYAYPSDQPVVRFLDTRGLEDDAEDQPELDLKEASCLAHLLVVVVRLEDSATTGILRHAKAFRKRHPDWPVVVAITRLHDLYDPGQLHQVPYPFTGTDADLALPQFSDEFRDLLAAHYHLFQTIPGKPPVLVPLDFTRPEAGLAPSDYGADRIWQVLAQVLPGVYARLHRSGDPSECARRQIIVPWAFAAAGADAVPLPVLGGLASSGLQARMVVAVAERFEITWTSDLWKRFLQLLGTAFVTRYAAKFMLRQGLKLLPGLGAAAVAVLSFGVTYALGEAAIYFCRELAQGREPDRERLRQTYAENLDRARQIWRQGSVASTQAWGE